MVQCKEEMGNCMGAINVYAYKLTVPMGALNYPTHEEGGEVVERGVELVGGLCGGGIDV